MEARFKKWAKELTLDLKEIMLNSEWYYKISNPKTTETYLYLLYAFASVWFIYTVWHFYILIK
jgi:hypothetical protein